MSPLRALCLAVVAAAALPGSPARAAAPNLKQIALPPSALPERWVVGGAIGVPGEMSNSPSKGVRWFSRIYTPADGTGGGGLAFVVEQIYFAPDHAAEISSGLGRELRSRKAQRIAAAEISALW